MTTLKDFKTTIKKRDNNNLVKHSKSKRKAVRRRAPSLKQKTETKEGGNNKLGKVFKSGYLIEKLLVLT